MSRGESNSGMTDENLTPIPRGVSTTSNTISGINNSGIGSSSITPPTIPAPPPPSAPSHHTGGGQYLGNRSSMGSSLPPTTKGGNSSVVAVSRPNSTGTTVTTAIINLPTPQTVGGVGLSSRDTTELLHGSPALGRMGSSSTRMGTSSSSSSTTTRGPSSTGGGQSQPQHGVLRISSL